LNKNVNFIDTQRCNIILKKIPLFGKYIEADSKKLKKNLHKLWLKFKK